MNILTRTLKISTQLNLILKNTKKIIAKSLISELIIKLKDYLNIKDMTLTRLKK